MCKMISYDRELAALLSGLLYNTIYRHVDSVHTVNFVDCQTLRPNRGSGVMECALMLTLFRSR